MRDTYSCGALLFFGVASGGQKITALGGDLGLCQRDDLGFTGLLRGGVVTPVEQP